MLNPGMRTYPLAPETIRAYLLRTFWRFQLIVTVSFLVFGVFLTSSPRPIHWSWAVSLIVVIALSYFILIFYYYRRQMRVLYSLRIEIYPSYIILRQVWREPLFINRADVIEISEQIDGLHIKTNNSRIKMVVPYGLAREGDIDVRRELSNWLPIVPLPYRVSKTSRLTFWFSLLSSLLILLFANTLWVALPLGMFLFIFGTYAEQRLNQTYKVEPYVTQSYSLAFSFLIFLILIKSCLLLFFSFQ